MGNDTQSSPQTPKKPQASPSAQDQAEANQISAVSEMIKVAAGDSEITTLMLAKGYDPARYAAGQALVAVATDTRTGRQTAIGTGEDATLKLQTDRQHEETAYVDFREDVRAEYPGDDGVQTALGVKGKLPHDLEKLITAARVSYKAAKLAPYAAVLSGIGYDAVTLDADLLHLDELEAEAGGRSSAKGSGIKATSDREAAMTTLQAWASRFARMAKRQLKARPDLLAKLKIKHG